MAFRNNYLVKFDFTTFRNSTITGRKGEVVIHSKLSLDEIWTDEETIKRICHSEIIRLKPKWQVFSITIKEISHDKEKKTNSNQPGSL